MQLKNSKSLKNVLILLRATRCKGRNRCMIISMTYIYFPVFCDKDLQFQTYGCNFQHNIFTFAI